MSRNDESDEAKLAAQASSRRCACILMAPYVGHIVPSLALSEALCRREWQVCYIAFDRHKERILDRQLPCEILSIAWEEVIQAEKKLQFRRLNRLLDTMAQNIATVLRKQNATVLLIDPFLAVLAEAAIRCDIPVAYLYSFDASAPSFARPPASSALVPRPNGRSAILCGLLWAWHCLQTETRELIHLNRFFGIRRRLRKLAVRTGVSLTYDVWRRHPDFFKFLLYPAEIEVGPRLKNAEYAGLCVLPDAPGETTTSKDAKVVLCSLGSMPHMYRSAGRIFRLAIEAMQDLPNWRLILNVGKVAVGTDDLSGRISVVRTIDQRQLLREVDVMITHAGYGTLKECIATAVPMVAIPCDFDQFGNASRMVHHGLGVRVRSLTRMDLVEAIRAADGDSIRKNIAEMRTKIERQCEIENAIDAIDRLVVAVRH